MSLKGKCRGGDEESHKSFQLITGVFAHNTAIFN